MTKQSTRVLVNQNIGGYVLVNSAATPGTQQMKISVAKVGSVRVGVVVPGAGRTINLSNSVNANIGGVTVPAPLKVSVCDSSAYATMEVNSSTPTEIYIDLVASDGLKAYIFYIEITDFNVPLDNSIYGDSRWKDMKTCPQIH